MRTLGCTAVVAMSAMMHSAAPAQGSPTPIAERATATLVIPGFADFLVADGDAVWATNEGRVELLHRDRALPVASVAIDEPCGAMSVAYGALWVANCRDSSIYRVDLATRTIVAKIRTGLADPTGELSLAAGAGSVWVLSDKRGILSRIDARTNHVVARINVAPNSFAAAFDFGAVWVTNTGAPGAAGAGAVQRIDPDENAVVATIPVGPTPRFLATGEGGVWTLNQGDGSVTRIDPHSNRAIATIALGMRGTGGDIAAGGGRVWVRGKTVLLAAIDPTSDRVVEVLGPPAGSGAVRVAGDWVWVTAHDIHTVWVLYSMPR